MDIFLMSDIGFLSVVQSPRSSLEYKYVVCTMSCQNLANAECIHASPVLYVNCRRQYKLRNARIFIQF